VDAGADRNEAGRRHGFPTVRIGISRRSDWPGEGDGCWHRRGLRVPQPNTRGCWVRVNLAMRDWLA
jgi:hypothetical protein